MKTAIVALLFASALCAQTPAQKEAEPVWEMDNYVVGILRKGPNTAHSKEAAAKIQAGHMAHISHMASVGKLIVAGPFTGNNADFRGMFIFKATLEEAKALASEDPAVKAGRLALDLYPWFAGKGLGVAPPKRP